MGEVLTTGNLSVETKTFYDRTLLEAAKPTLVHTKFGQERPIPVREGGTIQFRRFELLPTRTTPLQEGVTPPSSAITITPVTATPRQYGDYITVSDLLTWTAIDPILTEIATTQGVQAGETLDDLARSVLVAGTTVRYAGGAANRAAITSANIINGVELRKLRRTLRKNRARPRNGYYDLIVAPDTLYDMQSMPEWLAKGENSTPEELEMGMVRKIYGFRVWETEKALPVAGAGAGGIDVFQTVAIGENFYGNVKISGHSMETIMKPLGSGGTEDPLNQRATAGWKATYVAVRLNELFGARLEHAVTP